MKRSLALGLSVLSLLMLAACGYRAELQRPPPRWGEAAEQQRQQDAQREQAEQAEDTDEAQQP